MFEQEEKKLNPVSPPPSPPSAPAAQSVSPQTSGQANRPIFGVKAPAFSMPEIHTMPEKLIGAPAGHAPVLREIIVTKEQNAPAPVPVKPKKKKVNLVLVIALIVVLLGVSTSVVILYVPFGKNVPVANLNANVPPPPPVNENTNVNANVNENVNTNVPPPPPPPPRSGPDADSDGLTDVEETTIYHSNLNNTDTDGDSFSDGNEVLHLFDPTIKAPALLKDSSYVRTSVNAAEKYTALTPASWSERGAGTDQYFIDAPSGEFFEILAVPKSKDQSIMNWYLATSPDAKAGDVAPFQTYENHLDGIRSADRLTAYIDLGDEVLTVTYNPNGNTDYNFLTTFEMVIASIGRDKP